MTPIQYYLQCELGHSIPLGVARDGVSPEISDLQCLCGAPVELVRSPATTYAYGVRPDDEAWPEEDGY